MRNKGLVMLRTGWWYTFADESSDVFKECILQQSRECAALQTQARIPGIVAGDQVQVLRAWFAAEDVAHAD